jgi:hypothetical protein
MTTTSARSSTRKRSTGGELLTDIDEKRTLRRLQWLPEGGGVPELLAVAVAAWLLTGSLRLVRGKLLLVMACSQEPQARTYISPWLRGFTYRTQKPTSETRSTLALATAATHEPRVALKIAQLYLKTAQYPRHDDALKPGDHQLTDRIQGCRGGVEAGLNTSSAAVAITTELTLYLPPDSFTDLTSDPGDGRVDLSICLGLPGDERLQLGSPVV